MRLRACHHAVRHGGFARWDFIVSGSGLANCLVKVGTSHYAISRTEIHRIPAQGL